MVFKSKVPNNTFESLKIYGNRSKPRALQKLSHLILMSQLWPTSSEIPPLFHRGIFKEKKQGRSLFNNFTLTPFYVEWPWPVYPFTGFHSNSIHLKCVGYSQLRERTQKSIDRGVLSFNSEVLSSPACLLSCFDGFEILRNDYGIVCRVKYSV